MPLFFFCRVLLRAANGVGVFDASNHCMIPSLLRPLLVCALLATALSAAPRVQRDDAAAPRAVYGAERLEAAVKNLPNDTRIVVGLAAGKAVRDLIAASQLKLADGEPRAFEGFVLASCRDGSLAVVGADDSGVLYGCLELASRVKESGALPAAPLHFADAPTFKLRGPCIGMQKTFILPGRKVYEYPYTPELFPFFYDKAFWHEYLDFLADQRMNTLTLWNGHPFASLVKLADYPEAVEVPEDVFAKNVEMFRYIAQECDRRGIWLVQQFYSILLSKPFAEKHGMATQLSAPNDLAADYTRKSIAEFVKQYPNVGLMPCLGEALQNIPSQVKWCTDVILPGVHDGMKAAGLTTEPPVVLRTHATDAKIVVPEALKVYQNLYTEAKYNGESLTTWEPRGVWQDLHQTMSRLGSTHVANVHILANLEPFRYGDVDFIQKSVLAMRDRLGARGLHLYPLFYWNWPDSPDIIGGDAAPLKQWHRDWIWFEAWARYAWNPDLPAVGEHAHWIARLTELYGTSTAAEKILAGYNAAGECAPRILRRFGITEGNRQTMSLGMTLDELVNPAKYKAYNELWDSQAPLGERLQEYVEREWKKQPHAGETPPSIIAEILDYSAQAVADFDAAAPLTTKNLDELARLQNDARCIRAMSQNYAAKANAALLVLRYAKSHDVADMERAEQYLSESLDHYRTLAALTKTSYTAANSMQTSQRRVPVPGGVDGKPANYHWTQLLPVYEKELTDFRAQVAALKNPSAATRTHAPLTPAKFRVLSANAESYTIQTGNTVFSDTPHTIQSNAPELEGLQGIKFSNTDAKAGKLGPVEFSCDAPVRVLIGYFQTKEPGYLRAPTLETDATAADRGGAEPMLLDAVKIDGLPPVNVHAFDYPAGRNTLEIRDTGAFLVLGVIPQK